MNNKSNKTTFRKGHKKIGGFVKGDKHTQESIKKISNSLYGKKGKLSRRWKGDMAGYVAIHTWVKKEKGKPICCENNDCLKLPHARFEWASISGECIRDLDDFISLCTPCHRRFDNGNLVISLENGNKLKREKFVICENCNHKNIL